MAEVNQSSAQFQASTLAVLQAIVADLTALAGSHDTLVAKLNADAGVTDEDYADAAALTTTLPA